MCTSRSYCALILEAKLPLGTYIAESSGFHKDIQLDRVFPVSQFPLDSDILVELMILSEIVLGASLVSRWVARTTKSVCFLLFVFVLFLFFNKIPL